MALPVAVKKGLERPPLRWRLAWGGIALLSGTVALVSFRYLFGKALVPETVAANSRLDPWIIVHAVGAATALLFGPWQFQPNLRQRRPMLHRAIGRIYVVGCLSGGVSALALATGVSTGPIACAGFAALGTVWLGTTGTALQRILSRDVASHRRWMVRSFALALSAVTLRIYMPLSAAIGLPHLPAYQAIAWLCWVPNMLVAEWYLGRRPTSARPSRLTWISSRSPGND